MYVITDKGGVKVAALFQDDSEWVNSQIVLAIKSGMNVVYEVGGASLWWHAGTRQLMAMRSNAPLQLGEEATFKAHIQKAGYAFKAGIKPGTLVFIDGDLNAWRGVVWVLADVPVGVGEVATQTQERLL